jgi:hypothetical protein
MTINIIDLSNILVNGENFGAVADAIANNPGLASDIQTALQEWWTKQQQSFNDEKEQMIAGQQQAIIEAIANANTQSAAQIAEYQAQIAALTQELESLKNPPTLAIDWANFRLGMLNNEAYQRLAIAIIGSSNQGNWTITTLQNVVAMDSPRVDLLIRFWNAALLLTPIGLEPNSTEVDLWAEIARQANVPISFESSGIMIRS